MFLILIYGRSMVLLVVLQVLPRVPPPFLNILTYLDSEIASIRIYWLALHNQRKNFDQAHIVPSGGYCYPLHA